MRRLLSLLIACLLLLLGASGPNNTLKTSLRSSPQAQLRTDLTKSADMATGRSGPSVFMFILDDAGRAEFSSYSRPEAAWPDKSGRDPTETPEMDELSQVGTMMMMAHDSPACVATKCDLQTGLGSWRTECSTGAMNWDLPSQEKEDLRWLTEHVITEGAQSFAFGKTGGLEGFNDNVDFYRGNAGNVAPNYGHYQLFEKSGRGQSTLSDTNFFDGVSPEGNDPHMTDRITTDVLAKISAPGNDQTFWWIHPHDPHSVVHMCVMLSDGTCRDDEDVWGTGFDDRPWRAGGSILSISDGHEGFWDAGSSLFEKWNEAQVSMFEHLDYKLGEMIDAIDLTKDYVIVVSDDGAVNLADAAFLEQDEWNVHSNWDCCGKGGFGENHPPLWIAGPGIRQQARSHFNMTHRDLYYTVLAMMDMEPATLDDAGQPIVRSIADGVNLLPYLQGGSMPSRRFLQSHFDSVATNDGYTVSDQRLEYKYCFESDAGAGCHADLPGGTAAVDQLFFKPDTIRGITSGTIFEYLRELYTTQHLNIENDMQSWCYDGSGNMPAAHACEDFEQAVPTDCVTDTTADAIDGSPSAGEVECDNTSSPLVGTQDLIFTGTADYLVWRDLSPEDFILSGDLEIGPEVIVASTSNLKPGTPVTGSGIPDSTTVETITNATTFQLSDDATTDHVTDLTFDPLNVPGTGCTDSAICIADFVFQHSVNGGAEREVFGFREEDDTAICVISVDNVGNVVLSAQGSSPSVLVTALPANTPHKVRLKWDSSLATPVCSLFVDATTGTHGSTSVGTENGSSQLNVDEFFVGNETNTDRSQMDRLVIVGHEPVPAGRFDNAIEGLGFGLAQNFEEDTTCTLLGLIGYTASSDESFCSVSTDTIDGGFSFSVGDSQDQTNDWWALSDPSPCAGLSGETCEIQFDFMVPHIADTRQPNLFTVYTTGFAETAMTFTLMAADSQNPVPRQTHLRLHVQSLTNLGSHSNRSDEDDDWIPHLRDLRGHDCGPVDLGEDTRCPFFEDTPYRLRIHIEEDGNGDHFQSWLWKLDSDGEIESYVSGNRIEGFNHYVDDTTSTANLDATVTIDDDRRLLVGMGVTGTGIPAGATLASFSTLSKVVDTDCDTFPDGGVNTDITVTDTSSLRVGYVITGTGIAGTGTRTLVKEILSGTSIVASRSVTAQVGTTLTFSAQAFELSAAAEATGADVELSFHAQIDEPAEIWFGPNVAAGSDPAHMVFDNFRVRLIPNAEL